MIYPSGVFVEAPDLEKAGFTRQYGDMVDPQTVENCPSLREAEQQARLSHRNTDDEKAIVYRKCPSEAQTNKW